MQLEIFYSVQNGGDGSAYPEFMESQKLAEWDQEHMEEWGEDCSGSLSVESDSPIKIMDSITTELGYYLELLDDDRCNGGDPEEFKAEFFPDGLPKMVAKIDPDDKCAIHVLKEGDDRCQYRDLSCSWDDRKNDFIINENRRKKLQKKLNAMR